MRKQLLDTLKSKGIHDEQVLQAMDAVPRHFFLDSAFDKFAYEDRAFPIDAEQTISQPYTVAYMTSLLGIKKYDKVLEIGTGSAYQASILAEMGAMVYTIERQKKLFTKNQKFEYLKSFKTLKMFYGDGFRGLPKVAPFDAVIITAAAPEIPPRLVDQLKVGGTMVLPFGDSAISDHQVMLRITKLPDGEVEIQELDRFSFVPMLKGKQK